MMRFAALPALVVTVLLMPACADLVQRPPDVEPEAGEVQFTLAGPGGAALVVPVNVNEAGPFPFVLDTGATLTCVDEELVKELNLPNATGTIAIGGGIRGLGPMRLITIESLAMGDATATGLLGCAVDLSAMQKAGLDVRGLLGLNFLKAYRVTLDFNTRIARLDPPVPAATR
jgi:predicted aspartyl protease